MAKAKNQRSLRRELDNLKNKVIDYEHQLEGTIEDHPVASVGIAFGVGALVGAVASFLLSRR
tara:strand:- start:304 stop:489 length:186 start_codon:yes stop_codon:yes gene_type:complete